MTASWPELVAVLDRLKAGGVATAAGLSLRYEPHVGDGRYVVERLHDGTCSLFATPGEVVAYLSPMGPREWALEATG